MSTTILWNDISTGWTCLDRRRFEEKKFKGTPPPPLPPPPPPPPSPRVLRGWPRHGYISKHLEQQQTLTPHTTSPTGGRQCVCRDGCACWRGLSCACTRKTRGSVDRHKRRQMMQPPPHSIPLHSPSRGSRVTFPLLHTSAYHPPPSKRRSPPPHQWRGKRLRLDVHSVRAV